MKRKLISLFLGLVMAVGSVAMLASCAENEKPTTTLPPIDINPNDRFLEKLPADLNFANEGLDEEDLIVNVAYVEGGNGDFTRRSLQADELDESTVDIKTLERDKRLKSQLGLELWIDPVSDSFHGMESAIGTALAAGESDYDVLAGYQYFGIGMATKGYLINLADLAVDDADYIDMDAPYWGKAFNDNMSYKGAYYWITGDIALRYIGGMYCTFVNSAIYTSKLEGTHGSIYTIAKEGKWTIDLMNTMAAACYEDNGATPGEKDAEDTFGFGWESMDPMDGLALGCGAQFCYKDPETGDVSVVFANTHNYQISDKINDLCMGKEYSYQYEGADSANVMPAFAQGTVAFTVNKLFMSEVYLEEMEDFYIIPAPKFDETQETYITGVHDGCTIFGITHCTSKVRQSAAALEFLCAYSSQLVAPEYYEGALKGRYTRDPQAAEMIDLIHDNVTTDFAIAWGASINNIGQIYRSTQKITNATINRDRTKWTKSLETLTKSLDQYASSEGAE